MLDSLLSFCKNSRIIAATIWEKLKFLVFCVKLYSTPLMELPSSRGRAENEVRAAISKPVSKDKAFLHERLNS